MIDINGLIVNALRKNVRVNVSAKTVEIYSEYGVKFVLRDLSEEEFNAFKEEYPNF